MAACNATLGKVSSIALILGGVLGAATAASAQNANATSAASDSGEIIVTATRREESVQKIPASISALSEAALKQANVVRAEDIVHMVPGLAYTENSTGQAVLAIRGIQTGSIVGNLQSPVAIYYNDVPVLDLMIPWSVPTLRMFDVSRVEVLRGPQGTLFGAGALSGAMRIITNKPDLSSFHAATEDTIDSIKGGGVGYSVAGMVNVPLVRDVLALRAVGYYDRNAGWVDNSTLGRKNVNHASTRGGRVTLDFKPSEKLDITATLSQETTHPHDSSYVPYGSGGTVATNRLPNYSDDNTKIANLAINYSLPFATLTSSTSYIDRNAYSFIDFSAFSGRITGLTTTSPLIDRFRTKNLLQEVRLVSTSGGPFKWVIGAFGERYRFDLAETISQAGVAATPGIGFGSDLLEDVNIRVKINDWAGFGELSYDILPGLTVTGGVRYSHYSIHSSSTGGVHGPTLFDGPFNVLTRDATHSAVTPKASLAFKPNNDVMVYALAAKGYRTGNSNLTPLIDPFTGLPLPPTYAPDNLWNYEVGTKLALLDRRLRIDLAAFYIDWKKIQLQVAAPGSGFNYVGNAGTATSKGVEAQIVGKLSRALELGTTLTYTDAKLKSLSPGVNATVGDQLPGSAPFSAYVYGDYKTPLSATANLTLRLDYSYTGREYSYLNNKNAPAALRYGKYSAVGAQATVDLGRYSATLFVRNLADGKGRIAARTLYPQTVEVLQTPRTIGATFRASW